MADLHSSRPASMGFEVGAVTVKWAEKRTDGSSRHDVVRHEGNPRRALLELMENHGLAEDGGCQAVMTGAETAAFLDCTERPEVECLEAALKESQLEPDLMLALGGENFSAYTLKNGRIQDIHSLSKCAAGTGEFFSQQLARMGLSLEEGIAAGASGKRVRLATRCSVHLKSDATHKLNKGECTREDIVCSLIHDLAAKVYQLVMLTGLQSRRIALVGGLSRNLPFVDALSDRLPGSTVVVPAEGYYYEAYGAAVLAAMDGGSTFRVRGRRPSANAARSPLADFADRVDFRAKSIDDSSTSPEDSFVLGVDAGSTTTKAVLVSVRDGLPKAGCYLRTNGHPIEATRQCLIYLRKKLTFDPEIVQTATTGSGRELVSVFLDGASTFNEIIAHSRAAADEAPGVRTIFEIGGQDSKYMYIMNGVPVDYAMNEGCSAGTGSFLEESASVDMSIDCLDISDIALKGERPPLFGERCSAFMGSDLRSSLGRGANVEDVVSGLVYSIADNYVSRVVGTRQVDDTILFQGGVALNRAVALAIASQTGSRVIVPRHPELMGCIGAALLARDRLLAGELTVAVLSLSRTRRFTQRREGDFMETGTFRCHSCENDCEIKKIRVKGKTYPFGGNCSKYSRMRRKPGQAEGTDLFELQRTVMFSEFAPEEPVNKRGIIGIPLALSTYSLFPLYARFVVEIGYGYSLVEPEGDGQVKTLAPLCYPAELAHEAVHALLRKSVDFVFVPGVHGIARLEGVKNQFSCPTTALIGDVIRRTFHHAEKQLLTPELNLELGYIGATRKHLRLLGTKLGVSRSRIDQAFDTAYEYQQLYWETQKDRYEAELAKIDGQPQVVVAGRPYMTLPGRINLSIPRKIASRGFHVIPHDAIAVNGKLPHVRNCWHQTQQIMQAVENVKEHSHRHLCVVSCFSCAPDSMIFHEIRDAMERRPFCYLEIDSHTADAGVETRIEAFLEIVDGAGALPGTEVNGGR